MNTRDLIIKWIQFHDLPIYWTIPRKIVEHPLFMVAPIKMYMKILDDSTLYSYIRHVLKFEYDTGTVLVVPCAEFWDQLEFISNYGWTRLSTNPENWKHRSDTMKYTVNAGVNVELKSCPFCGSDDLRINVPQDDNDMAHIRCVDCGGLIKALNTLNCPLSDFKLIDIWNHRHSSIESIKIWYHENEDVMVPSSIQLTLKPCPFCGSKELVIEREMITSKRFTLHHYPLSIHCKECGATMKCVTVDNSQSLGDFRTISTWNKRCG